MLRASARNGFVYSLVRPSNYVEGWKAYLERNVQGEYRGIELTATALSELDAQRICNRDAATRVDWRSARADTVASASEADTARHTIHCTHPETGVTGCWIFSGNDHRKLGTSLSPVFPDFLHLCDWMQENGWKCTSTHDAPLAVVRTRPMSAAAAAPSPGPVSATGTGTRGLTLGYSHPQGDPPGLYPSVDL